MDFNKILVIWLFVIVSITEKGKKPLSIEIPMPNSGIFLILKNHVSLFSAKSETCKTSPIRSLINQNPNKECIFPFTFEGTKYTKCSDIRAGDSFLSNICATETEGENNEIVDYGVCSDDCDKYGILVAGGYSPTIFNSFEVLSSEPALTNTKLARLPKGILHQPSLFLHGNDILLCGGYRNRNKCLMHENDSWKVHSYLKKKRVLASAVTTANGTFIFGGRDSEDTFEFLGKNSMIWQLRRTKIPNRFWRGCAVEVSEKQEILLIGGALTYTRILKFDIKTQTFDVLNVSLLKERLNHACARLPGTNLIVIAGGYDADYNIQDTSEILNLDDNRITLGNPMTTKRAGHGMAVITIDKEDRLAVFGGANGNDWLDSVETLNPTTRKWEVSNMKLKGAKYGSGYTSQPNYFISNL